MTIPVRRLLVALLGLLWLASINSAAAFDDTQSGDPLDPQLLEELLEDRQNFSMDAIIQIIKKRGVTFELEDSARRRLIASASKGKRDASLMEPVMTAIAENCKQCTPDSDDCKIAESIRSGAELEPIYLALSEGKFNLAGGPRFPELLLAALPSDAPLSGTMLAVLCRAGATERRLLQLMNNAGLRSPNDVERARTGEACPKPVVDRMTQLLTPPCADGQERFRAAAANSQPRAVNGQFDLRLGIDDYAGVRIAGDNVCVEVLRGGRAVAPKRGPIEYHRAPLPRRATSAAELDYSVLEGSPSNVQLSMVPAQVSHDDTDAIRVLIKDPSKGVHDYHVRILWALKPIASTAELNRVLEDLWSQEQDELLRTAQRRGLGFTWSDAIRTRLKEASVPDEVISSLSALRRLECDSKPFSSDDLIAAVQKSIEQYTSRAKDEIANRGVLLSVAEKAASIQESPVWNSSVKAAIQDSVRQHNRPGSWSKPL